MVAPLADADVKYLNLLAKEFPTRGEALSEIINLQTILNLPRGTEHFVSDLHGESQAFQHILNNCSGVIREQVRVVFEDELDSDEQAALCTLVYYPREKIDLVKKEGEATDGWYLMNLTRLVRLARWLGGKYTRSKVRKSMPSAYAYIIDELMHATRDEESVRRAYHHSIFESIIETGSADDFIISISGLIKRLAVDHLHVVGDIFDRGPHADRIMEMLKKYHSVDIQWGNHDIVWMGAACGSAACIASVVRTNVRYGAYNTLESAYGVSLRELALFAEKTYKEEEHLSAIEKAIDVILFKVEGQTYHRHPNWQMSNQRLLLHKMDLERGVVEIDGKEWPLTTTDFPTLDPEHPYELSPGERQVMHGLVKAFRDSTLLHDHIRFMYEKGSVYLKYNGNLLFHGCIPLDPDGSFSTVVCGGIPYKGQNYLDYCDRVARRAWATGDQAALDWMYYLWCGAHSPLSGRVVKTFERAFVADKEAWHEPRDPYYEMSNEEHVCMYILEEFDLVSKSSRIINGHTPVKASRGESPIRANGRKLVIDGGFCEAYHNTTGIAGYTLVSGSHDLRIKAHRPFRGVEAVLNDNADIVSESDVIKRYKHQVRVEETDRGDNINSQIADLYALLDAYRTGVVVEGS